jgi:hypothetical protein
MLRNKYKLKSNIFLKLALLLLIALPTFLSAAPITWTGSTTGTQAWTAVTNWSGSAVPANASDLVINLVNGDALIITAMPTRAFNSLTINVASGTASIIFKGTGTTMTLGGNIGTDFTLGTGVSCTFAGTGNIANLTMAALSTADIAGNLFIAAGSTMACSSSTFIFTGSGTQLSVAGTFTPATSTMNFSASGNQNIPALTYNKLTTSGSGTKTLAGNTTVSGVMTIEALTILDLGTNTLTLSGTGTPFVINGTFTPNTGTVIYSSATANVASTTYNNLEIKTVGTKAMVGNVIVGGILVRTAGTLTIGANTLTLNGGITNTAGTLTGGATSNIVMGATASLISVIGTPASALTLKNLTINSGTTTLTSPLTISSAGVVSLNGGIITTTATTILNVTNTSSSAITGAFSNSSYINGPLKWTLPSSLGSGSTYVFPVGVNGAYYPFTLNNPTTGATGPVITIQAFASGCGGSSTSCITTLSTTEHWSATIASGNFTSSSVSVARSTGDLTPLNAIGHCATVGGVYTNLNGTASGNSLTNSDTTGSSLGYFALGTTSTLPVITTPTSASINISSANLGGNITNTGCSNVIERGIFYSTSPIADGAGTKVSETSGPYSSGTFTISVTGLMFGTTYYFKAFATNAGGTVYTSQGTFTTTSTTFPLIETFEGGTTWPTTAGSNTESLWAVNTGGGYNGSTNLARLSSGTNQWLFTPAFTATAGKIYYIQYDDQSTNYASSFNIYLCTSQSSTSALVTDYANGTTPAISWSTSPTLRQTSKQWLCTTSGVYYWGIKATTASAIKIDQIKIVETNPVTITWDGSSDGIWTNGTNWDLNRVPSSSDRIVIPAGATNYPTVIPSGNYNELTVINGSNNTMSLGDGTSFLLNGNLTIASTGQPVTIENGISLGGNLSIGATDNVFTCNINASINTLGSCVIGNNTLASTFNFAGKITATGNLTLGQNASQVFNVSYCDYYDPFIVAANTSTGVEIYGTVNYNGNCDQIMLPNNYKGDVTLSGSHNKYQSLDMYFDGNLNISGVKYYPADHDLLEWGTGSTVSGGTNSDNTPYRGANKSERWQSILYVNDLNGTTYSSTEMHAGDYLRSISFYVMSKVSSGAYHNFTIKVGHTNATKISQDPPIVGSFVFEPSPSTTVFTAKDVTTTSGWNNHIFDADFQWNGTQNILVEITWLNSTAPGGDDQIKYTSGVYAEDMMISIASGSDVTNNVSGNNYNARPNVHINYIGTVHNIFIKKDWNNSSGEFVAKGNTVTFNGSETSQTITTNNNHFYNLTFSNPAGYSLSSDTCSIENTFTMDSGNITTSTNVLELGMSPSVLGTLNYTSGTIIGNFRRWYTTSTVSDVLYPIGTATRYCPLKLSFTVSPTTGGAITSKYTPSDPGTNGVNLSLNPLIDTPDSLGAIYPDGFWSATPTTLIGGTYGVEVTATGINGVTDYSGLHLLKRHNATSNWEVQGTHLAPEGTNDAPILKRAGLTSFSDYVPSSKIGSALPINLLDFKATCENEKVIIQWTSISELNNDYYTIEKSEDLTHWTEVDKIAGAGNSNQRRYYSIFDLPSIKTVYYRLKQTDFDSKYKYYGPVASSPCSIETELFELLTNPAKDKILLRFHASKDENLYLYLTNTIGELLIQRDIQVTKGENSIEINSSILTNGIYFCGVRLDGGKQLVKKVVVSN